MAKKRKQPLASPDRGLYPYCNAFTYLKESELTEEDKAFCLLVWCGMPAVRAYRVCYPTNANAHSLTTMVSRMKLEGWLRDIFCNIRNYRPMNGYDFKDYWDKCRY